MELADPSLDECIFFAVDEIELSLLLDVEFRASFEAVLINFLSVWYCQLMEVDS
jgi:hypothetical protein